MPVNHRFLQTDFGYGFVTHNAILDEVPYEPEVLFIGTNNPDTDIQANRADFFYGRNYFWPTMFNLLVEHHIMCTQKRSVFNPLNPPLPEILDLCIKGKVTFADLIKGVLHHNDPDYNLYENSVVYQGVIYNLINDNDLSILNDLGQVEWGTNYIVEYIRNTISVNCVRLTRQPTGVWEQKWNQMTNANYGRLIDFGTIHTPSGMGLREQGIPIAQALARRWVHHPVAQKRLCREWLQRHQVPVGNFNYPLPPLPLI